MEINWNQNITPENKAEIEKHLTPFLWLVPKWCQKITVNTRDGENHGDLAGMRSRFEYREVEIDIYGYWFLKDEAAKRDAVVHELCHFHNYALFHFADSVIDEYVECEKSKNVLKKEVVKYLEGGTQDLTFAILDKFNAGN